jgi:hypothetical protein
MKRRIARLVTGTAVLCAVAVSSAAGAVSPRPEFGQCTHQETSTHTYSDAGCTQKSAGKDTGSYVWTPREEHGAPAIEEGATSGGTYFHFTYGPDIECDTDAWNNDHWKYKNCHTVSPDVERGCTTFAARPGEVLANALLGRFGYIDEGRHTVGIEAAPSPHGSAFTEFDCEGSTTSVTGGVIGKITPTNAMSSESTITFGSSGTVQQPSRFLGAPELVLDCARDKEPGAPCVIDTLESVTWKEPAEIRTEVAPAPPSGPPDLGRCRKVPSKSGGYANASCTKAQAGGSFEWTPGAAPGAHVTTAGGRMTLETVKKSKVVCTAQSSTGEYSGTNELAHVVLTLTGCEMSGLPCASAEAKQGEIISADLEGQLGIERRGASRLKDRIALDLAATDQEVGGMLMVFRCGGFSVAVRGSVLAPVATNKMLASTTLKYAASKAKQKPEQFEGGPRDVLEISLGGSAFEPAGETLTTVQTSEEPIEVNTVN